MSKKNLLPAFNGFGVLSLFILCFSLLVVPDVMADTITNIEISHPSPSYMANGQNIEITFDYSTTEAGGVRIFARPFTNGALTPNYGAHGSPIYAAGQGSGTGSFTISTGTVHVDQIRFQMLNADQSQLLLEFFIDVSYFFGEHAINNIEFTPDGVAFLEHGENVEFSFDYSTTEPGGVRIFGRPSTNGAITPDYAAHPSSLHPVGAGSDTGFFTISSGTVTVNEVRFQMLNADQSQILLEFFVPVGYHFSDNPDNTVVSFTLIDAETDLPVDGYDPIPDNATLDIRQLPPYLNIRANVAETVGSVRFDFNDRENFRTESVAPYALFGDSDGDFSNGRFPPGAYTLKATPFSEERTSGEAGTPAEISFISVREDIELEVTGLVLVDAQTDEDLFALSDGMTLYLADLPADLNVRADVAGPAQSVRFDLAPDGYTRTENVAPYALFGDASGDYAAGSFSVGSHTLTAAPFQQPGASGRSGNAQVVELIVEAGSAPPKMHAGFDALQLSAVPTETSLDAAYPNPFNPSTTIRFALIEQARIRLIVYDLLGREVRRLVDGVQDVGYHEVVFEASDLPSGAYLYRLETPAGSFTQTMLLLK